MATKLRTLRPSLRTIDTRIAKPPPKQADAHYQTDEHKAWRLQVMRQAKWRCQWPGCTVHHPARLFADHIVEVKDGGAALDPENGQALCGSHHTAKTAAVRAIRFGLRPDEAAEGVGVESPGV